MKHTLLYMLGGVLLLTGCVSEKVLPAKEERICVANMLNPNVQKSTSPANILPSPMQEVVIWSQSGATGQNLVPHVKTGEKIEKLWSTDIGTGLSSNHWTMAEPVVANRIIYVLDADFNLSAIRLRTGKKIWKTKLPLNNPTAVQTVGLAYSYEKLFAVSGNGTVVCVDLDGKVVWEKNLKQAIRSTPTIYRNKLYLLTANNQLIALNTDNGAEISRYNGMPVDTNLLGMGTPAMYKNKVVVPFSNGEVIAFNTHTDNIIWTEFVSSSRTFNHISDLTHILASPVIEDGIVYLIGNSNKMGAYRLNDGTQIWSQPMGGNNTPALSGNTLFMINNQNILMALDKKTGKIFWDKPLIGHDADKTVSWKGPLLAGNQAIVASSAGDILFFDLKTGELNRRIETDGIVVSPIAVNETVLFLTIDAELIAYK